jgi:hypothetical protein
MMRSRLSKDNRWRPCRSRRAVCILAALVYDTRASVAGRIAVENPRIQPSWLGGIAVGMGLERGRKTQRLQCELKPVDHRVGVGSA